MSSERTTSYSSEVIEHFERPRHAGLLAPANDVLASEAGSREQGTHFAISVRITGGVIADCGIAVFGCPHCIAAVSLLSERLIGREAAALRTWRWLELDQALALPASKRGRLLILEDAVHALGAKLPTSE